AMAGAATARTGLPRLFWAAFRRCRNGLILVDGERRCVDVNAAFVELLGYKRSELIGRRYHEFAVKPPLSDEAWRQLTQGSDFYVTRELRRADGQHVSVELAGHRETVTGRDLILVVVVRRVRGSRSTQGHNGASDSALTAREREIVELIALGLTGPRDRQRALPVACHGAHARAQRYEQVGRSFAGAPGGEGSRRWHRGAAAYTLRPTLSS